MHPQPPNASKGRLNVPSTLLKALGSTPDSPKHPKKARQILAVDGHAGASDCGFGFYSKDPTFGRLASPKVPGTRVGRDVYTLLTFYSVRKPFGTPILPKLQTCILRRKCYIFIFRPWIRKRPRAHPNASGATLNVLWTLLKALGSTLDPPKHTQKARQKSTVDEHAGASEMRSASTLKTLLSVD